MCIIKLEWVLNIDLPLFFLVSIDQEHLAQFGFMVADPAMKFW